MNVEKVKIFLFLIITIFIFRIYAYAQDTSSVERRGLKLSLIAIASTGDSLNSSIARTFGRAEKFIIYDLKEDIFTVLKNEYAFSPSSAGVEMAWKMVEMKIAGVLTQNCGSNSMEILNSKNIKVFRNVGGTVKSAIEKFKEGKLEEINY